MMFNSVSSRQIQREYKKVLAKANKSKRPIVVISRNKPMGAIIGLDLLEKIQLEFLVKEALDEHKAGKTKVISNLEALEREFEEIRKLSGQKW